jgi:hypothetical protein
MDEKQIDAIAQLAAAVFVSHTVLIDELANQGIVQRERVSRAFDAAIENLAPDVRGALLVSILGGIRDACAGKPLADLSGLPAWLKDAMERRPPPER